MLQTVLITLSLIALLFQGLPGKGTACQLAAIGLNVICSLTYLPHAFRGQRFSRFEMVAVALCIVSFLTLTIQQIVNEKDFIDFSLSVTALMTVTVLSVSINARIIPIESFMNCVAMAAIASTLAMYAVYPGDILASLTSSGATRWALRFSGFENHPNLEGLIFGSYILYIALFALREGRIRWQYLAFVPLALGIILAAGARGGLLALLISSLIVLITLWPRIDNATRRRIFTAGGLALVIALAFSGKLYDYLTVVLELDSKERGFGSGASGRTDIWAEGISMIGASARSAVLGGGLRSSDFIRSDFYTESSYISILLDSGIIFGGTFILMVLGSAVIAGKRARARPSALNIAVFMLLNYGIFESFFNRYLFAMGNPFSVSMMYMLAYVNNGALDKTPAVAAGRRLYYIVSTHSHWPPRPSES
ncbi:MAG TPA: O-antigen ligase family protein [Novosphingobium sp.]|nr:O-antigen ligase family protein [Novosphingobium sp.]